MKLTRFHTNASSRGSVSNRPVGLIRGSLGKEQLVEVIKAYKSRTYDEDLAAIDELGGKYHPLADKYRIGMDAIAEKLNVNLERGLKDQDEADDREGDFGTNKRDLMKPKPCWMFLKEQLSDVMLLILIFAAILSLILNFATASPEEYATGKFTRSSVSTAHTLQ